MTILVIGDLHFPFHHKKALTKLFERLKSEKFDHIIQIGDLLDQYAFSRFAKKNTMLPEREIKYGRELAVNMWDTIKSLQPESRRVQILGNHDVRIIKKTMEHLPEVQDIVQAHLEELYRFECVHTLTDPRQEYVLKHPIHGSIAFIHGYKSKIGDHTRFMHMNTVHGHRHRGEVTYIQIKNKTLWEMDVGFLADKDKGPLSYTEQRTSNWTLGHSEIDSLGPRFVPYNL